MNADNHDYNKELCSCAAGVLCPLSCLKACKSSSLLTPALGSSFQEKSLDILTSCTSARTPRYEQDNEQASFCFVVLDLQCVDLVMRSSKFLCTECSAFQATCSAFHASNNTSHSLTLPCVGACSALRLWWGRPPSPQLLLHRPCWWRAVSICTPLC